MPTLKQDPAIDKAMRTLETLSLDDEEREVYEARLKWLRDEAAAIQKAELKGHVKGRAEGIEQMVINMIKEGLSLEVIMSVTKMSQKEIEILQGKTNGKQ